MFNEETNYPNGLTSLGIPLIGSGYIPVTNSKYLFVDGTNGNDGADGLSLTTSLKTIKAANDRALANDVILVLPGTYTEAVVTTVAGLHFIALGTATNSVVWTSLTDTYSLTIGASNTEVSGFRFKCPVHTAGTPAAIKLNGANYAHIHNNRFSGQTGSWYAIYSPICNSDNVSILNNEFIYMNTATNGAAIFGVEAGGLSYSAWKIKGNSFNSCVTAVNINGRVCSVMDNTFDVVGLTAAGTIGTVCTLGLDLSGTSSGGNQVHRNYFNGAYTATLYKVGASGDDWSGNFAIGGGTGVAGGITTANPA